MIDLAVVWRFVWRIGLCVLLVGSGYVWRGVTDKPVMECKHETLDPGPWVLRDRSDSHTITTRSGE
jgi:hypothetical protein